MAIGWRYIPPALDAIPVVAAAAESGVLAAAEHLLTAAQKRVPVESGRLRDSGQVTPTGGASAAVSFGREDDAELTGFDEHDRAKGTSASADYAVKQHEDMTLDHPNGGSAKYLEQPMHEEAATIGELLAGSIRKAISE